MKKRVWKALLCCVLAMAILPAAAFAAPEADITITDLSLIHIFMEKDRIWRHKPHILRTSVPPGARLCYTIPTNSLGGNSYAVD